MLPFEDQVQRIYDFYVRKKRTFDIVSDSESENEGNAVPSLTKRVPKRQKRGKHSKKNAEKPNIAAETKGKSYCSLDATPKIEEGVPLMVAQKIEQLNDEMKRIENEMSKLQKRNEQLNLELARTKEEHQRICGYNIQNLSETELTDLIKLHENSLAKVKAEYFERTQIPYINESADPFGISDVLSYQQYRDIHLCLLCRRKDRKVVFLPCHHDPLCENCVEAKREELKFCHICNELIECTLEIKR